MKRLHRPNHYGVCPRGFARKAGIQRISSLVPLPQCGPYEVSEVLKNLDIEIFPTFIIRPAFDRKDFEDLKKYCLALDLDFIGFSVLTPLPGTDLYNEVKDRLITSNYDYFDFFHTLLPTTLPMKDFYRELTTLYKTSRSLKNRIKLMRKYPFRELPSLFRAYGDFLKRVNTLEQDYRPIPVGRHGYDS